MSIAIEGIVDYEYAEYVRSLVPADGYLKFYIGTAGSWRGGPMDSQEIEKIRVNMEWIDNITGLAWKEVYSESEAQIRFFKATSSYYDDPDTTGMTESDESGMTVTWLDEPGDPSRNGEGITIKHEIGHVASLDHPYGDGFNDDYDQDDTIMSYNSPPDNSVNYTDSDKLAMKSIWGEDRKVFVPGHGTHYGTVFADQFFLEAFDGFGEGSADIINDFSISNGDTFTFTTSSMGWDDSAEYYRFIQTKSKKQRKKGKQSKSRIDTANKWDDANALIYNKTTGELFVDNNGSEYGLGNGGLVAIFTNKPALSIDSLDWVAG